MYLKRISCPCMYVKEMEQTDRQSPCPRHEAVLRSLADWMEG